MDYDFLDKKFEVYSYKFPNNTIYVGYTSHGLDIIHCEHKRRYYSPVYESLKKYPDVYPQVELTVENITSFEELNKIQRKIFDSNLNMKILNVNLWLYGY